MEQETNYGLFDEKMFELNFSSLSNDQRDLFASKDEFNRMKNCYNNFTHSLKEEPELVPNEGIEMRLLNTMDLKKTGGENKVYRNSFADVFLQVFSLQNIGIKLAMASLLLVCSFWFSNPKVQHNGTITADSTYYFSDTATNTFDDSISSPVILFVQ